MARYYRRVIRVTALDSPNVRLALAQIRAGLRPTNEQIVPGVLSWAQYVKRRATWDKIRQAIGLDAQFWEGAELLMFPPTWLDRSEHLASERKGDNRQAKGIGIDPAEGGDRTAMAAVDEYGLIELVSKQTPNTDIIPREALAFMLRHGVPADRVCFDRGGGGKQHADRLRAQGYPVRTVAFGESLLLDPKRGLTQIEEKLENREERYVYVNRRAEMYGELRERLDPSFEGPGFGIPAECPELRRQLAPIPLLFDREGRLRLLPKNKPRPDSNEQTLTQLIGCSPDEADATVLALHAMLRTKRRVVAGAV